ncbi:MAG: phosphoethanolamine--lipid A transferase [Hylemonella sp.]|uniref:phosphoethanolamine transferase n=1 Tax=Hylemonella sp. TaxID=2066020 RepID=UPI0022CBAB21|nr:phosphoethanolamine--lipid A transferase [Hylemonella sp.]MCZ8251638.1 phosphoethanolamine--lipid A transferase [Hylemonella sp.]
MSSAPAPTTRLRPIAIEHLIVLASLYWVLSANSLFFEAALQGRSWTEGATWGFLAALALGLFGLHVLLLSLVAHHRTVKSVLSLLLVCTAASSWFMQSYGIYLDPTMVRNVLRTDVAEARELWSGALLVHLLLYAGLPLLLLHKVQIAPQSWRRAVLRRAALIGATLLLLLAVLMAIFQPLASLMRNHKDMRYLATPANLLWSTGSVLASESRGTLQPRQPLDPDARLAYAPGQRPRVLVLVVGETARAANWGLSGYARQTTPELARLPVLNMAQATSCGTNTEVSVPCLFAPVGRRDYDETRIRGSESLLHLLTQAGVTVHWRDNQSGCKGVCDGLPQDSVAALHPPGLCAEGRCLDEGLLAGLDARLSQVTGTQVWVLHMLGNHGPSYFRRYPAAYARFQPACEHDDLRLCTREEIVNAYDNALLYTDHVLASLIGTLQAHAGRVDSFMLYVSDHGESLGEKGLYLHGMPYAIAPGEQTRVPMTLWWSQGWAAQGGLDPACLRQRAAAPAQHDHVFHTVLGLLEVQSKVYDAAWDLGAGCHSQRTAALAPTSP